MSDEKSVNVRERWESETIALKDREARLLRRRARIEDELEKLGKRKLALQSAIQLFDETCGTAKPVVVAQSVPVALTLSVPPVTLVHGSLETESTVPDRIARVLELATSPDLALDAEEIRTRLISMNGGSTPRVEVIRTHLSEGSQRSRWTRTRTRPARWYIPRPQHKDLSTE